MITDPTFFQNELLGYVKKKVKDKAVAEDIVHDVFLKVQAKSNQIRETGKVVGWIYQITRNTIIDHFRFQSRIINATDLDWEDDKQYLNLCVERCLTEKLATLPQKYREALELSEVQGVSQLELAKRLNISYSGAKSRVQRARQMLKEMMEREYLVKLDNYGNVIRCENRAPCNCAE
ncbi:MAG TPA: sigma-70 family RNA polymerase sigma factor [Cyclobacteriaceae bacterium]|nr:sigma-70 family RNA polymerase sigma factor [Cyclobacteriaceae bacterium]